MDDASPRKRTNEPERDLLSSLSFPLSASSSSKNQASCLPPPADQLQQRLRPPPTPPLSSSLTSFLCKSGTCLPNPPSFLKKKSRGTLPPLVASSGLVVQALSLASKTKQGQGRKNKVCPQQTVPALTRTRARTATVSASAACCELHAPRRLLDEQSKAGTVAYVPLLAVLAGSPVLVAEGAPHQGEPLPSLPLSRQVLSTSRERGWLTSVRKKDRTRKRTFTS